MRGNKYEKDECALSYVRFKRSGMKNKMTENITHKIQKKPNLKSQNRKQHIPSANDPGVAFLVRLRPKSG